MPRKARKHSITGIYHITWRGINRQDIFEDEEDYTKFIAILKECKSISNFEIYAYCLMSDHVHLLIRMGTEEIDLVMKRIGIRFTKWYNKKYQRVGHLFQDRYNSEIVETERYLLTAWRYILQNPMKAGMEKAPGTYPWSSIGSCLGKKNPIAEADLFKSMFEDENEMLKYLNAENEDTCLDIETSEAKIKTDEEALQIMAEICQCKNTSEFQMLNRETKSYYFGLLKDSGLPVRQISRVTGSSRGTIERAIRKKTEKTKSGQGNPKENRSK